MKISPIKFYVFMNLPNISTLSKSNKLYILKKGRFRKYTPGKVDIFGFQ